MILLILATLCTLSCAQIVMNGDPNVAGQYKRAKLLEDAAKRKIVIQTTLYADMADSLSIKYDKAQEDLEYKERGSYTYADGTPIPGNENIDLRPIDPRTPAGFGNPFKRDANVQKSLMSQEVREASKFWNVTIAVEINGETVYLPIFDANFNEALATWYSENYEQFAKTVENKPFQPNCEVELTDDMLTAEAYKYCPDHCHCYGHIHQCCLSCAGGKVTDIYECVYYKSIEYSQIAIAKSIFYERYQDECVVPPPPPDPENPETPPTKQQKLENPIELKKSKDHPMGKDIAIAKGVF